MIGIIIFISVAVIALALTIYLSLKTKIKCPDCNSEKIIKTGNRKYHESPNLATLGSPNSYYMYEYKCKECDKLFWLKKKAIIFN